MKRLYVGFDDINDARAFDNLELLVDCLKTHLTEGGVVIVEHRLENAAPEMVVDLDSVAALESWLAR